MLIDQVTITSVASGNTSVQGVNATTNMRLLGYCVRESSGTPALATLNIRHGTTNSDTIVAPISLLASTTMPVWLGPQGVPMPNGVYVERTSGNATLSIYTKVVG